MSMRLLPKSDIAKAKANARRLDIDEGVKLARRVDNLREVAAQEETSLEKFRRETIAQIHADIQVEQQKLDGLKTEVKKLERNKKDTVDPLVKKQIAQERTSLVQRERKLAKREEAAERAEKVAREATSAATDTLARARAREDAATAAHTSAVGARKKAETALQNSESVEAATLEWAAKKTAELTHREKQVEGHEQGLILREAELEAGNVELAKGWRLLHDREAMLERAIKRN